QYPVPEIVRSPQIPQGNFAIFLSYNFQCNEHPMSRQQLFPQIEPSLLTYGQTKMYTKEPEYNKETITSDKLFKLARRSKKPKIYNPKTNRMIAIDGPAYNQLICNGYMHWEEEKVLVPPIHEKLVLGKWFASISNHIWGIVAEKSLLTKINGNVSLLEILLKANWNEFAI
ncbi:6753_t:CDS:2, partial [Entrophospora sp. SA101]